MYIINPINHKKYLLNSLKGKTILKKYVNKYIKKGSMFQFPYFITGWPTFYFEPWPEINYYVNIYGTFFTTFIIIFLFTYVSILFTINSSLPR